MKKQCEPSMSKITAAGLGTALLSAFLLVACAVGVGGSGEYQHTGPVTLTTTNRYGSWQFEKPDGTIFVLQQKHDQSEPDFTLGEKFTDLTYLHKDKQANEFVSANKDPNWAATAPATTTEMQQQSSTWEFCGSDGCHPVCCTVTNIVPETSPKVCKREKKKK